MKTVIFYSIIIAFFVSCQTPEPVNRAQATYAVSNEQLIEMNKAKIANEHEMIEDFLSHKQWKMDKTERGIYYQVYEKGQGGTIENGNEVWCDYQLTLLSGEKVYDSNEEGILKFIAGKNNLPSGLEEAILRLHQGDKAHIIVPSYLAYGLAGDGNKVPSAAILCYNIYVKQVSN